LPVTIIITAYNEEKVLKEKIENTLTLDYPPDKLTILFVTDGSADNSEKIISGYSSIKLLHQPERQGKYAAIKRAMKIVGTPIVIFSDANSILNSKCIKNIVSHYSDKKVGGVAGEKKIMIDQNASSVGLAEGIYWQYESVMKKLDADFYTVVGAAGELFSIRTALFKEFDNDLILDDFVISMQVCLQGYKIDYEPGAYASESPTISLFEEEKRKVRISAGAFQSFRYIKGCMNIFKYPKLSFQFISRRFLRWFFCPWMLVFLLITNIIIVSEGMHGFFYNWILYAQIISYLIVLSGWIYIRNGKNAGLLIVPFYFVFMNYCLVRGFFNFLSGKQTVLWEKSKRHLPIQN